MPKPKRITKIEYDRIDRVPAGAQPHAHIPLVKARRVRLDKLIDPASIDARVQAVRDEFREKYSNNYGCCSPCSGWVYVDAVYDAFVIACDSDGSYWQFSYTQDAEGDVEFGEPEAVKPSVKWSPDTTEDDAPPMPVAKSKPLWSASLAERVNRKKSAPVQKEHTMPAPTKPDLTALDDATREAVEAALAENETLTAERDAFNAAVEAAPEIDALDDDDEALDTIEGIEKAIKKARSPETKRMLKTALAAAKENASLREGVTRLQKAERVRLFKERARVVGHMAAHAGEVGSEDGGVTELAKMLEEIDEKGGSDLAERVEKVLTKAHVQTHELLDRKGLLKSAGRNGGEGPGAAMVIGTNDDPEAKIDELVAEIRKSAPDLSEAQAKTRVLKAHPELYAAATAAQ